MNSSYLNKLTPLTRVSVKTLPFAVGRFGAVVDFIVRLIKQQKSFVCVPCTLHELAVVSRGGKTGRLYRDIDVCTADGVPIVWYLRRKLGIPIDRVYGPELVRAIVKKTQGDKFCHVFYGSSEKTIKNLEKRLFSIAPNLHIAAMISPPFRPLTNSEESFYLNKLHKLSPTILWIGLSSPKQIILAGRWRSAFPNTAILCVGAAFDLLAGTVPSAPTFVQRMGGEWLFRLIVEPKRLARRYLIVIPRFLLSEGLRRAANYLQS